MRLALATLSPSNCTEKLKTVSVTFWERPCEQDRDRPDDAERAPNQDGLRQKLKAIVQRAIR